VDLQPEEWLRATNLLTYARDKGLDRIKVLDTYGMLLTRARLKAARTDALREVRTQLEQVQAHQMVRRLQWGAPATADDMFRAVTSWLDDYIAMKEQEEV
jgi:hypothetical protein